MNDPSQTWLDRLFAAYRESFHELDASPNFVPSIWARIDEERRMSWVFPLRQWATRLVGAAAVAIFILAAVLSLPNGSHGVDIHETSYVDALAEQSIEEDDIAVWLVAESAR